MYLVSSKFTSAVLCTLSVFYVLNSYELSLSGFTISDAFATLNNTCTNDICFNLLNNNTNNNSTTFSNNQSDYVSSCIQGGFSLKFCTSSQNNNENELCTVYEQVNIEVPGC